MGEEPAWEELEHPADVRLRIRGESLKDLLENAARGMVEVFLDPATVQNRGSFPVEADGEDAESLLINWLQEILFIFDAERFAPCRVEVTALEEGRVIGRLGGEQFDPDRHGTRTEIKAVTWHNLELKESESGLEVTVVFDV
jgi:SHS2 domain-containing protein